VPLEDSEQFTQLLSGGAAVDSNAILPLVYDQLRRIAQQHMNEERREHTLQATALVHEAWVRLAGDREIPWQSREHFFVAAAEAMRRILLDHARAHRRQKRGGPNAAHVRISVLDLAADADGEEILALDEAFCRLERQSPQAAAVVRLRFYAGRTVDETAAALEISPRQVDRLWSFARAWLYRALRHGP
jgi:RNA polymerase sigma factor (TIGR02999 family)